MNTYAHPDMTRHRIVCHSHLPVSAVRALVRCYPYNLLSVIRVVRAASAWSCDFVQRTICPRTFVRCNCPTGDHLTLDDGYPIRMVALGQKTSPLSPCSNCSSSCSKPGVRHTQEAAVSSERGKTSSAGKQI